MAAAIVGEATLQPACEGKGPDGQHCCQINGGDCRFLTYVGDLPRCSLHDSWDRLDQVGEWVESPIGQHFAAAYPGYTCKEYPQDIPAVMDSLTAGKCCYEGAA